MTVNFQLMVLRLNLMMTEYKADATGDYKNDVAALDQLKQRGFECGIDVGGLWFLTEPTELWRAKAVLDRYGLKVVDETTARLLAMDRLNEDPSSI